MSNHDDVPLSPDQANQLLRDAREKARALVDRLVQEQAEVEKNPPAIAAADLAEGRAAMARAVAAARRTLQAIDAALAVSGDDSSSRWN
jgi:hypothetical protein